jgi:hypothetical protein
MQSPKVVTSVTQRSGGQAVGTQARAICWRLRGSKDEQAVCGLYPVGTGWLLRIDVDGSLQRAQEFASQREWINAAVAWKSALLEVGWREAASSAPRQPMPIVA